MKVLWCLCFYFGKLATALYDWIVLRLGKFLEVFGLWWNFFSAPFRNFWVEILLNLNTWNQGSEGSEWCLIWLNIIAREISLDYHSFGAVKTLGCWMIWQIIVGIEFRTLIDICHVTFVKFMIVFMFRFSSRSNFFCLLNLYKLFLQRKDEHLHIRKLVSFCPSIFTYNAISLSNQLNGSFVSNLRAKFDCFLHHR